MFYIYLHIKKTNGEPFYVGKGKGKRSNSIHNRNKWWKNIVSKYGFDVIIIEDCLSEEDSLKKEKYWIKRIGRKDLGLGPLVNMTDGGEGICGLKFSDEHRKKIALASIGNKNGFGKKYTDIQKQKMSKMQKELQVGAKIVLDIETGIYYDSIMEAAELRCMSYSSLMHYLKGRRKNKTNLIIV